MVWSPCRVRFVGVVDVPLAVSPLPLRPRHIQLPPLAGGGTFLQGQGQYEKCRGEKVTVSCIERELQNKLEPEVGNLLVSTLSSFPQAYIPLVGFRWQDDGRWGLYTIMNAGSSSVLELVQNEEDYISHLTSIVCFNLRQARICLCLLHALVHLALICWYTRGHFQADILN